MEEVFKKLNAIDKKLGEQYREFKALRKETTQRFDAVDKRFDATDKHLYNIDNRLLTSEELIDFLAQNSAKHDTDIESIKTNLDWLIGAYQEDRQERLFMNHAIKRLEVAVFPET